ncbi:AAT-domain-containing protein [Sarocladium strictum]
MLEIYCSGTPREIGFKHGSLAKEHVLGGIKFYEELFLKMCKLSWSDAQTAAKNFLPFLEEHVPHLIEEMRGIAEGAEVSFDAILALNCRTEISMGLMDDGCTSLGWKTDTFSIAAQNWDWDDKQKARLVLMHIKPARDGLTQRPNASVVTEAGMLCKSGINSSGVTVLVNAVLAKGVKYDALPVHVALRTSLESETRLKSVARLHSLTMGTSGHIMIGDKTGATSLEFSHMDVIQLDMIDGQIAHTNHFLVKHHPSVKDAFIFPDSFKRMDRITLLLSEGQQRIKNGMTGKACVETMLEDEDNFPTAINRKCSAIKPSETLYCFVADLEAKIAYLRLGRPTEPEGAWVLKPADL